MSPDRLYSKTHEWVRVEADPSGGKIAVVGLTAFALEALTDLVFVDLPPVGQQVKAGQPFGEIESVKAVSDLYSPVDGRWSSRQRGVGRATRTPGRRSLRGRLVHQDQDHQRSRPGRTARRSGVQETV